ncbi:MAG: sigma factor-like helix-turn-helix DNA-binding protein [Planctomycetota bacterium]|nr:sigma factor-like helix-turn-helix DNA-binding protein [Planctomycetota bacterium]
MRISKRTRRVRQAMERIPDVTDRAILVLRVFVGLSLRQISDRLRLSTNRVRAGYRGAIKRMERELGEWL